MIEQQVTGLVIRVSCKMRNLQSEIAKAWHLATRHKS